MTLKRLLVHNVRNIEACDLTLSSGFNFLIGKNGSGKTSLLEAIYYLGHGRSFRRSLTNRVIRYEQESLVVHGQIEKKNSSQPVLFGICKHRDGQTEVKIAGEKNKKLVELAEILPMQLITPEGFELLTGGPKFRRSFIDWGVFHFEPQFFSVWSRMRRLMKQRNAELKGAENYQQISHWDAELTVLANQIDQWRKEYVEQLNQSATKLCQAFLPEYQITMSYRRGWDKQTEYAQALVDNFYRDRQVGYTNSGPHKADLCLRVGKIPVEDALSRGQLKLMMCALRLAQGQLLTKEKDKQCIYLIDDFASELDEQRRMLLAQQLNQMGAQVFVSAINAEQVSDMSQEKAKMFHVGQGRITTN